MPDSEEFISHPLHKMMWIVRYSYEQTQSARKALTIRWELPVNVDQNTAKIRGYVIDLSGNSQRGSLELGQRLKFVFMNETYRVRISEIEGKPEVMLTIDIFVAPTKSAANELDWARRYQNPSFLIRSSCQRSEINSCGLKSSMQ